MMGRSVNYKTQQKDFQDLDSLKVIMIHFILGFNLISLLIKLNFFKLL